MSAASLKHLSVKYARFMCFELEKFLQAPSLQSLKIDGAEYSITVPKDHDGCLEILYAGSHTICPVYLEGRWEIRNLIEEKMKKLGFDFYLRHRVFDESNYSNEDLGPYRCSVDLQRKRMHSNSDPQVLSLPLPCCLNAFIDEHGELQVESDCYKALLL